MELNLTPAELAVYKNLQNDIAHAGLAHLEAVGKQRDIEAFVQQRKGKFEQLLKDRIAIAGIDAKAAKVDFESGKIVVELAEAAQGVPNA